jgi:hypothetical protein
LGQLDVVVPVIRGIPKAVPLGDDVEEDKEALFYTDVLFACARFGVFDDPVSELNEGELVHVTEVVEAIWNAMKKPSGSVCTSSTRHGHVVLEFSSSGGSRNWGPRTGQVVGAYDKISNTTIARIHGSLAHQGEGNNMNAIKTRRCRQSIDCPQDVEEKGRVSDRVVWKQRCAHNELCPVGS